MDTNAVIDYLGNKISASGMDFMNAVVDAVPNVLIVVTALVYGFVLISRNISDFKNIDGLTVINPHTL